MPLNIGYSLFHNTYVKIEELYQFLLFLLLLLPLQFLLLDPLLLLLPLLGQLLPPAPVAVALVHHWLHCGHHLANHSSESGHVTLTAARTHLGQQLVARDADTTEETNLV